MDGEQPVLAPVTHEQRGLPHADLIRASRELGAILHESGARMSPALAGPDGVPRESALVDAVDLFIRAGHVEARETGTEADPPKRKRRKNKPKHGTDVVYIVPDEARLPLNLAKNIVVHFFVSRAMVAVPLAVSEGITETALSDRVQALSRLFKYEFQFRADAPFSQIFQDTLAAMHEDAEITREVGKVSIASTAHGERVKLYTRIVMNFLEGYRVAARSLSALLRGPLAAKDLAKRAISTGERMFLAAEITRREAVSRLLFDNAFASFVDQGYLTRTDGKLALSESYTSAETVRTIEARVVALFARAKSDAG